MSNDDNAIGINHDRLNKTELPDAFSRVVDLGIIMLLSISIIRFDLFNFHASDFHILSSYARLFRAVRAGFHRPSIRKC